MKTIYKGQSVYSDRWFKGYYFVQGGKHYIVENGMAYQVKRDTVKKVEERKREHLLRSHNERGLR